MDSEGKYKIMTNAMGMDYQRRRAHVSRLKIIGNEERIRRLNAKKPVEDRIEKRRLRGVGHIMRVQDNRWTKIMFIVYHQGRPRDEDPEDNGEKARERTEGPECTGQGQICIGCEKTATSCCNARGRNDKMRFKQQ